MLFKKKKDLRYEVLNGANEVVFTGYAPECLEFYETDKKDLMMLVIVAVSVGLSVACKRS